eukprot:m.419572 g.419572  ORF g.419572 m.419572 type:complete len:122 (+) comp56627_c0_seq55:1695-2060(+)
MMCACSVRSVEFHSTWDENRCHVIPELLRAGADIHLRNKAGLTAKELARENMPKVAQLLQEHEEYLAQLGSSTKAALRTPVDAAPLELADEVCHVHLVGRTLHKGVMLRRPTGHQLVAGSV